MSDDDITKELHPKAEVRDCDGCGEENVWCEPRPTGWLCESCWHEDREKEQPYVYRRLSPPHFTCGACRTLEEAQEYLPEFERINREKYEIVPAGSWHGDRVAHAGYMTRRRAEILKKIEGAP